MQFEECAWSQLSDVVGAIIAAQAVKIPPGSQVERKE